MALGEESDSTRLEAWRRRVLISVFCPREEGETITSLPLPSLMLEGECEWMLHEATSDRTPVICPASPLLSMEALSVSMPVRRATTLPPAVSCDTLMAARAASTALCRRLQASTLTHCASSIAL